MTTKDEVQSTVEALRWERALKLALEALEECRRDPRLKYEHPYYDKTITAIRAALASKSEALAAVPEAHKQPAPVAEPHEQQEAQIVRWKCPCGNEVTFRGFTEAPASKTWAGLTQQDIDIAFDDTQEGGGFNEFARAIEAKLREKNGGGV